MRSLKQYWRQAVASIRKATQPHPHHTSWPDQLERNISVITSENQALSAELSRVRTIFEQARSEENRKIAALEQFREQTEVAHGMDREMLAVLERRIDELETERDQVREQNRTLEDSLTQAVARIENTEDHLKSVAKKLENEQRLYANTLQEIQQDQHRQNQRINWTITATGFALLLGTMVGGILIWDVQKNSRILAGMSSDMKALMTSINEHQSLQHDLPGQQLPDLARATTPEAASTVIGEGSETPSPQQVAKATVSKPSVNSNVPGSPLDHVRLKKHQGTQWTTREEADAYFKENAAKPGIVELPSGLQYRVVKAGSGKTPTMSDKVVVDYLSTTPDGKIFDSTFFSDETATYSMSEVIPGWQEALLQMQEGEERELFVPPQLAQKGSVRKRGITGFEPGVYLIELVQVIEGNE